MRVCMCVTKTSKNKTIMYNADYHLHWSLFLMYIERSHGEGCIQCEPRRRFKWTAFLFMTHFWLSRGYLNFLIPAFTLNYSCSPRILNMQTRSPFTPESQREILPAVVCWKVEGETLGESGDRKREGWRNMRLCSGQERRWIEFCNCG